MDELSLASTPVDTAVESAIPVETEFSSSKRAMEEIFSVAGEDLEESVPEVKKADPTPETEAPQGEVVEGEATEEVVAPKIVTAKVGDSNIELSDDAVFSVKVNKKEEAVPLKELIRNYQGKIPWEKHYQQTIEHERVVKQKEAEFHQRAARAQKVELEAQKNIQEIVELARTNPSEALMKACIKAGKSPSDVLKAVIEQSKATVNSLENMSEEQVQLLLAKKGLDFDKEILKRERETEASVKQEQAAIASLEQHIIKRLTDANIPVEAYRKSQAQLQDAIVAGAVDISNSSPTEITDLIIENVLQYDRPRSRISAALSNVAPDKASNTKLVADLHAHLGGGYLTNFTDGDLNEIIKGVFGSNGASNNSENPVQAKVETASSKERQTQPTSPKIPQKSMEPRMEAGSGDDPLSFDDILDSYR